MSFGVSWLSGALSIWRGDEANSGDVIPDIPDASFNRANSDHRRDPIASIPAPRSARLKRWTKRGGI